MRREKCAVRKVVSWRDSNPGDGHVLNPEDKTCISAQMKTEDTTCMSAQEKTKIRMAAQMKTSVAGRLRDLVHSQRLGCDFSF